MAAPVPEDTGAVYADATVCDILLPFMYGTDPAKYRTLERMRDSGYSFVSLTVAVDWHTLEQSMHMVARERTFFRSHPDLYVVASSVEDILAAKREGKLSVAFNIQGTNPLQGDAGMVEVFYRLGVRHMLLTYNQHNAVGGGGYEAEDSGLGKFGRMIVREMNRVGMLIDLSHTGYRTCMDVFEISSAPVCFTHSNPLGLWDNPRNIRDDQIRACARSGGVVGVNGIGLHMGDNDASSEKICDQIDYVANLVGPAHVGIGLSYVYDNVAFMADFNARAAWAVDASLAPLVSRSLTPAEYAFASPERMPELSEILLRRGHDAQAVRSILGGNWLRVLSVTWK